MKSKFFIITIIYLSFLSCNSSNKFEISVIDNDYNVSIADTIKELIELDKAPDIFYFNKKYDVPTDLPEKFHSPDYKDVLINFTHHPNDTIYKYETITRYDSIGRVIQYALFPCIISSTGGFNYFVKYNEKGQVKTIRDSVVQLLSRGMNYEFDYFEDGDIKQIREFRFFQEEPTKVISVRKNSE